MGIIFFGAITVIFVFACLVLVADTVLVEESGVSFGLVPGVSGAELGILLCTSISFPALTPKCGNSILPKKPAVKSMLNRANNLNKVLSI